MHQTWLFLHLASVIVWIGGMSFAHFCLRPAAIATLQAPQRLPLMSSALGRFFVIVGWSIALLWVSGIAMFVEASSAGARPPWNWNAMAAIAFVMTIVFAVIVLRRHPRMREALEAGDLPAAGVALDGIRRLVVLNLALGWIVVAIAVL
ncbi:MAG: CopD family protein [Burkholderiaceae bacterium]|nr:CopD family protein [Burkholderiaceae bacterium]